jgi:hypothetical protein
VSEGDGFADVPYGTRGSGDPTNHGIVSGNLRTFNLTSRTPSKFAYRVGCSFDAGCPTASPSGPYPNYFASGVEIFGAIVSINDTVPPRVVVGEIGLLGGGTVGGTSPVFVQSANDESGIKRVAVFADGATTPVGVVDYERDVNRCNWASTIPCQDVSETEIPVDTTQLSDGIHSIVVKVFDAADNEKASTTHYVTIKNAATTPPGGGDTGDGTGGTGGTGGAGGADTGTGGGSSSGAGAGLPNGVATGNDPAGGAVVSRPTLTVAFDQNNKSKVAAKYGRTIVLHGRLTDGGGAPVFGAQIAYSAQSTKAGARVQNLGSVRTDSAGSFSLSLATKLGSRQLRFAYSAQIGGPVAVTAQAQLDVIAPVTFRVGPKHVRNKHAVVFAGKLTAGPMPRKGKLINLQVVVDGRWHTFATVRSTKSGKFKYRYRFTRTFGRVTYRFRALSRYEAAYPFVAGHSKTVRVRVN